MNSSFAETLKKLRKEKGLSQIQLGNEMFVNGSTVTRWENGSRMPDAAMIIRLANVLEVDVGTLLAASSVCGDAPAIVIVDDNRDILSDSLSVLAEVIPSAAITVFNKPGMAIEYAKLNRIDLAFLDIEIGTASGFDLCRSLLEINPCTRVIYLTAYPEYSLKAWDTDACGFIVKPLTPYSVRTQLKKMRCSFSLGDADE